MMILALPQVTIFMINIVKKTRFTIGLTNRRLLTINEILIQELRGVIWRIKVSIIDFNHKFLGKIDL